MINKQIVSCPHQTPKAQKPATTAYHETISCSAIRRDLIEALANPTKPDNAALIAINSARLSSFEH